MIFDDINVSLIVKKTINDQKVPIPLIIENAHKISIESITRQITEARKEKFTHKEIMLKKKSGRYEKIYFILPGFARRYFWKFLVKNPRLVYRKMGNVAFTSVGMIGKVNGYFVPASIHPICFGVSSILKKPIVVNDRIEIREILKMTVLLDHDVIDGTDMARFIKNLVQFIENGTKL